MEKQETNAYILGTDREELHRLGLQHQVWASEARTGWDYAEFSAGQSILDLGCGPGFCSMELAYIAGPTGHVIGVDKSQVYIDFLKQQARLHALDMELHCTDFEQMKLEPESLDGVYCRWALCWLKEPAGVIEKVVDAMRPGAAFVAHEYFDWSSFQPEPSFEALEVGIAAALRSFKESDGEIDIGRELPARFEAMGLEVIRKRPMVKMASPDDLAWQWPRTFLHGYFPKLVEMGLLTAGQMEAALEDFYRLENEAGASLLCPTMVEVVAIKP